MLKCGKTKSLALIQIKEINCQSTFLRLTKFYIFSNFINPIIFYKVSIKIRYACVTSLKSS
jgi:hypothetical protein